MSKPFIPPVTPWGAVRDPIGSSTAQPFDPRLELSDEALFVASQNAYPIVAKHKARSDRLGLLAGAAAALILGGVTFASMNSGRNERPSPSPALTLAQRQEPFTRPLAQPSSAGMQQVSAMDMGHLQPLAVAGPMTGPASAPMAVGGVRGMPPGAAPTVVFDNSRSVVEAGPRPLTMTEEGAPALFAGASPGQPASASDASSTRSSTMADPANTIVQGTLIPAVLETAIHSDLPGYARAVVSQDVRSFDGSKILVPRSSRLIGEYKGGITAGQKRVYLMWTRLVRPDGVSIALASPAVDSAGEAGIGGKVNDHFLQRFGSAILLSLLGRASSVGSGGATVILGGGGQSAASIALQHDGQRAPTIRVLQGEPIRVFTARDLIFASSSGARG